MVYPCYVHYDLPSCCVLLLSWFGNKLSIQYIMNLSSANYPYFWSLFFCVIVPDYINLLTILQHTWALSSESSDSTQGFTGSLYYITISSALQRQSHYYLCFHALQILYIITMNIRMRTSEEYCGTVQWVTNLALRD